MSNPLFVVTIATVDQPDDEVHVSSVDRDVDLDLGQGPVAAVAYDVPAFANRRFEPREYVLGLCLPLVTYLAAVPEHSPCEAEYAEVRGTEGEPVESVVMTHGGTLRRTGDTDWGFWDRQLSDPRKRQTVAARARMVPPWTGSDGSQPFPLGPLPWPWSAPPGGMGARYGTSAGSGQPCLLG